MIPGVKDANTIDPDASLADLGLDSLMGVEVKQLLERDFELVLSSREIRLLNMRKIGDMGQLEFTICILELPGKCSFSLDILTIIY